MIYDVKHDGCHKARLVAGGHLTDPNTENIYSGVVIRLIIFLAELNKLELWGADVGNAYLEALTKEKVYIIAGPEFGDLAGHTLVIFKALYGLRSSGLCWHQHFADVL
jgi:adenylosuccinate synthase